MWSQPCREINNKIQLGENLNPLKDLPKVSSIDNTSDLKDIFQKVDKLGNLWEDGKVDYNLIRCLPGLANVSRQGQIYSIISKKAYAWSNYKDKKMLEFNILLVSNTYTNCSSLMIVLPVQIKKRTSAAQNIDATMITVNNFFLHWLKEVNIKCYPDDIRNLPTNNTIDIYRYSENMLKHLPAKSLDTIKETLLYNKENVIIPRGRDRRSNMSDTPADRTDANLASRIADFHSLIGQKLYYRIPLKFIFSFESNLNKLFESNA